ncbi:MAG: DUF2058 domain-containing protein [Methylococcaceae bacterium]|jgi:hypothetical protein
MARQSLQDQLLKAGLASSAQVKTAKTDKRKQEQLQRKNKAEQDNEAKLLAQKAQAEKIEKDRELNQLRQQNEERKQISAQIKQLIEANKLAQDFDGLAYHFNVGGKVKTLYVTEQIRDKIISGQVVVVKFAKKFELVEAEVGQKIAMRDQACLVVSHAEAEAENSVIEEAYKNYQIPDDLIW